jgi:hypothetical protein
MPCEVLAHKPQRKTTASHSSFFVLFQSLIEDKSFEFAVIKTVTPILFKNFAV